MPPNNVLERTVNQSGRTVRAVCAVCAGRYDDQPQALQAPRSVAPRGQGSIRRSGRRIRFSERSAESSRRIRADPSRRRRARWDNSVSHRPVGVGRAEALAVNRYLAEVREGPWIHRPDEAREKRRLTTRSIGPGKSVGRSGVHGK